jgi:CDP-diacylglycerol--serine O-phosphatidyltransferase
MEQNKKFKLVSSKRTRYILPNILTLGGVCLGISSIKFSIDGNFNLAVILILFAAILDALDGRIARLIKGTSEFGKELDSLTDFVSFGIAPVFILYFWELNNYGKLGWAIALIYSVCCVLRLARFNLTKTENNQEWKDNFFEGIPSPAGGVLVLMPLIYSFSEIQFFNPNYKVIVPTLFIIISILLISKFPTYSLKKIVVPRSATIFLLLVVVLYFGLLLIYTFNTLIISGFLYLSVIPISAIHYYKINKSHKNNLEDIDHHEDVL